MQETHLREQQELEELKEQERQQKVAEEKRCLKVKEDMLRWEQDDRDFKEQKKIDEQMMEEFAKV